MPLLTGSTGLIIILLGFLQIVQSLKMIMSSPARLNSMSAYMPNKSTSYFCQESSIQQIKERINNVMANKQATFSKKVRHLVQTSSRHNAPRFLLHHSVTSNSGIYTSKTLVLGNYSASVVAIWSD